MNDQQLASGSGSQHTTFPMDRKQKKPWQPEEDELLRGAVRRHGARKWSFIATLVSTRTSKQCCERWHAYLDPKINRGPWTLQEDQQVEKLIAEHGTSWSLIAAKMPGRTDVAIKNRFKGKKRTYSSPHLRSFPQTQSPSPPSSPASSSPPSPPREGEPLPAVSSLLLGLDTTPTYSGSPQTALWAPAAYGQQLVHSARHGQRQDFECYDENRFQSRLCQSLPSLSTFSVL
eukprot:c8291_g1_i2.p1 GENE.c8291_g1_i2~~c8291_g1_i2.p1  ORF type:complete len:247 (+),score=32.26 c8291_g1_i2:49-741(+)